VVEFDRLKAHFQAHGQAHVFRFWGSLEAAQRERLLAQAAALDLPALLEALRAAQQRGTGPPGHLEPPAVERLPEHGGSPSSLETARQRGEELLAGGRVALLVVAGGQATRLGFEGPKGAFPIGPVTDRCLFEIHAQKLRGLRRRFGRPLPWYVMTSPATDAATRKLFAAADCFGVASEDVFFFEQAMVPSFDFEDRLILAEPDRIMANPDGHGGSLIALERSGALDDMERRGITTLFYHQVDNPLVRVADPVYLGFHANAGAEMSCKVVQKIDPHEKVGVMAQIDGVLGVVEYTELDDAQRFARDERGDLLYWAGSVAIHLFETVFLRRVAAEAERWLPFHTSEKRITMLDDRGRAQVPEQPNGRKLERFVFDALPAAKSTCVVEASRAVEYSPIKNAEGTDSPHTAREDLVAQYRAWLDAAGVSAPPGAVIEIDHSEVDGPEDLQRLGIRNASEASDIVRTATGAAT
jgi:UDP-N-acetylglucosamine/UDP-N-acetylgalactosamine diphosphorylase